MDSHVTSLTYGSLGSLRYNLDADGRRTGVSGTLAATVIPSPLSSLSYNNDNSLASIGGASVTNNPGGNITAMNGTCPTCYATFSYDARGHLQESVTLVSGQWVTQDNSYDALGRRYGTSQTTGGGTIPISYMYDGLNVVLAYNGSSSIASLLGLGLDELYLENIGGVQSSVLKDALGSVVGLSNSSKNLTDTYSYEPYGASTHSRHQRQRPAVRGPELRL